MLRYGLTENVNGDLGASRDTICDLSRREVVARAGRVSFMRYHKTPRRVTVPLAIEMYFQLGVKEDINVAKARKLVASFLTWPAAMRHTKLWCAARPEFSDEFSVRRFTRILRC